MRRSCAALFATAIATVLVTTPIAADDTVCAGALTGTFDNVVVAPNGNCTLTNSTVRGTVKVLQGGRLYAISNDVYGNIEGDKSLYVWLDGNLVHGSIVVKEGGPDPLPIWFCRNIVAGNMHVEKTTAHFGIIIGPGSGCPGDVGGNTVGGNLTAYENFIGLTIGGFIVQLSNVRGNLQVYKTMGPGPKHVHVNTVHENLQCFENTVPFDGNGNTAKQAQGQCSAVPLPPSGPPGS